jgi:hypothetical protein
MLHLCLRRLAHPFTGKPEYKCVHEGSELLLSTSRIVRIKVAYGRALTESTLPFWTEVC